MQAQTQAQASVQVPLISPNDLVYHWLEIILGGSSGEMAFALGYLPVESSMCFTYLQIMFIVTLVPGRRAK